MGDDDTKKLLDATKGKTFMALRDEALIRLYYNTGARLSEIRESTADRSGHEHRVRPSSRQSAKDRRVRFGPKTSRAISRYLRARAKRKGAVDVPQLWMADKGARPLSPNGSS